MKRKEILGASGAFAALPLTKALAQLKCDSVTMRFRASEGTPLFDWILTLNPEPKVTQSHD